MLQLNGGSLLHTDSQHILNLDLNRYLDPSYPNIKSCKAEFRGIPCLNHIFLAVGSDELIDLFIRVWIVPGRESIFITPPTYGMYAVCVRVIDVGVVKVNLELSAEVVEEEKKVASLRVDEVCLTPQVKPSSIESFHR
jgi:histidinol-phosphate aminotransferase